MEIQLKAVYKGGDFDDGLSELYNGAKSLNGFARAASVITHAFLHEEVIYRATALKGARIYRKASKKGSFVESIVLVIDNPFVQGVAVGTVTNAFYDFMKYSLSSAVGKVVEPETRRVKEFVERKEPIISQLSESLEEPLKEFHRPVIVSRDVTIDVSRPKSSLVRMDERTLDYIYTDVVSDLTDGVIGNVTKYNTLTGYGRMYIDHLNKTYSFKIDDMISSSEKYLLTWSLDESYREKGAGKLSLTIRSVETVDGTVKRVIVFGVSKTPRPRFLKVG